MSKKRKSYSAEFKTKVVLELLEGQKSLNEIAGRYEILPSSLKSWKRQFLQNASLAFDKSTVVKEYKERIATLEKEHDQLAKKVGTLTIERDWLMGKLRSLDLSTKKRFVDEGEVQAARNALSLNRRLRLLGVSKTAWYYRAVDPFGSAEDIEMMHLIDRVYTKHPYYGYRKMLKLLRRLGYKVGKKRVRSMMRHMGLRVVYPKKRTTQSRLEDKKYPYALDAYKNAHNQVVVDTPNEVWSADITYIRLAHGYAYLAAIVDWHSKKVLAWRLGSTMDVTLTTRVLEEAIAQYGTPEIFNSDQGSQYTAKAHTDMLERHGIEISMNGKGRSIDNIAIERFWRTLKYEEVYPRSYTTLKEARAHIEKYIDLYNGQRLHAALDYKTPDEVYFNTKVSESEIRDIWLREAA